MIKVLHSSFRLGVLFMVLVQLFVVQSLANEGKIQKVSASYGKPINLVISSKGINRISLGNGIASKIICDIADITAEITERGNELFITSKKEGGSEIFCSVILASGKVLDIRFRVKELPAPSIIKLSFKEKTTDFNRPEIEQMMKAMISRIKGKYYVKDESKDLALKGFEALKAKQLKTYRYGELYGVMISLVNRGKETVVIRKEKLAEMFEGVVASFVEGEMLAPGEGTICYLVFAEGA